MFEKWNPTLSPAAIPIGAEHHCANSAGAHMMRAFPPTSKKDHFDDWG